MNTRLVWHMETSGSFTPHQIGFCKNRSTLDPILKLSNQIQQGFAKQRQTIGVFFGLVDLEKVCDTTGSDSINFVAPPAQIKLYEGNKLVLIATKEEAIPSLSLFARYKPVTIITLPTSNLPSPPQL